MTLQWRSQLGESERLKIVQKASETLWTPEGQDAFKYLTEERGLSEAVLRQFQIGFVPLRISHQTAGRIITPIFDAYGSLVAISTRHLYKPKNEAFWHEDFDKSFYLYGLHLAKASILKANKAIVVEGEFDVAYMHSKGIPLAVGLCGNALNGFQIGLLARYCTDIYLLFDGDGGGEVAFSRLKETYMRDLSGQYGDFVRLIPVRMEKGMDPDDFVEEHGRAGLIDLMKKSKEAFDLQGYL